SVFLLSPLALLLALALNAKWLKLKGLFRVAFFVPVITSEVVVALMFALVFDQDFGLLNAGLRAIGLSAIPWLRSPAWAMPSIILLGVWIWLGLNALYFLAGLQNIDQEYYEAAAIDGANQFQLFRYITIPLLKPVILFVVIQAIVGSYQLFTQPWVLTGGGPQDATLTITMYLYLQAFRFFNMGYASAIGYALVVIILTLSLIQLVAFGTFRREDA
ncbi:MAG: sugar ABC transporter permease, partial [Clostridia bacterium]